MKLWPVESSSLSSRDTLHYCLYQCPEGRIWKTLSLPCLCLRLILPISLATCQMCFEVEIWLTTAARFQTPAVTWGWLLAHSMHKSAWDACYLWSALLWFWRHCPPLVQTSASDICVRREGDELFFFWVTRKQSSSRKMWHLMLGIVFSYMAISTLGQRLQSRKCWNSLEALQCYIQGQVMRMLAFLTSHRHVACPSRATLQHRVKVFSRTT